jgi:glycosyltransferase involved in cell wall biosynthesis
MPPEPEPGAAVSVIVPTRNAGTVLARCLASVRAQTRPAASLIVVDNGSEDDTVGIARQFADIVVDQGPERSAQRNHGASLATGSHLLFIDADMVLQPGVIEDCLHVQQAGGAAAVIIPETSFGSGFWSRCRWFERTCYEGDNRIEAARFFLRDAFFEAGGYDVSMVGGEDWDLSHRVRGGGTLPRTRARILHDDGRLTLLGAAAKKRYYATGYARYFRKRGPRGLAEANPLLRGAFVRHWRRFCRHPLLALGMMTLKTAELLGALIGLAHGSGMGGGRTGPCL